MGEQTIDLSHNNITSTGADVLFSWLAQVCGKYPKNRILMTSHLVSPTAFYRIEECAVVLLLYRFKQKRKKNHRCCMHGKAIAPFTFVWCKKLDSKPTLLSSTKKTQKMKYHHATCLLPLTQSNQAREKERERERKRE